MAGFKMVETIDRPLPEVFKMATDLERGPEWVPGVSRIEKLTPGPLGVGTRFRETRRCGKRDATAVIEVTTFEADRRYSAGAAFPGGMATYHYSFTPQQRSTRVELVADVRGRWLGWLMVPLLLMALKRSDAHHLKRLKEFVERQPAASQP